MDYYCWRGFSIAVTAITATAAVSEKSYSIAPMVDYSFSY